MALDRLKDNMWIRQSFMLPKNRIDEADMRRRLMTTASFKFTDTTLGGNFVINAPPSYCRYTDPRMGGRLGAGTANSPEVKYMRSTGRFQVNVSGSDPAREDEISDQLETRSSGMGSYYSEAIDDNSQQIIMRFGTPAFNTLSTFFGQFYSAEAAEFARTGRASRGTPTSILENILVSASGTAGSLVGTMLALPFQPLIMGGAFFRFLAGAPPSKYYYSKASMFPYWAAVQNIVNIIGVNIGIVPQELTKGQSTIYSGKIPNGTNDDSGFTATDYSRYHQALPDIITPSGYIDVAAMATKAQRRANRFNTKLVDKMENDVRSMDDLKRAIVSAREEFSGEQRSGRIGLYEGSMFGDLLNRYAGVDVYQPKTNVAAVAATSDEDQLAAGAASDALEPIGDRTQYNPTPDGVPSFWSYFEGSMRDGDGFVSFRVDGNQTVQESFSNEVGESGIQQKANSMSSSNRSARFDLADGNIAPIVGTIVDSARSFVNNALDRLQLSGLAALAGSAFVDIPQVWQSAVAQMPSASYTMQLRSPYANRISQMQNLYIPLAMILAAGLPHMTGKSSYNQPFLVELYHKGRVNIRMGIIDSITVERGVGNVGWTQDGRALGIDVTFTVKDLSTVMAMPLTTQFSVAENLVGLAGQTLGGDTGRAISEIFVKSMFDDANAFTDYMAALGSLGFHDLVYAGRKWRLQRIKFQRSIETMKSPAMWSNYLVNATIPGRILNALALDTDRPASSL